MNEKRLNKLISLHYNTLVVSQVAHWNMHGERFTELHRLTDELYNAFIEKLDDMVEEFISHKETVVSVEIEPRVRVYGTPEECLQRVFEALEAYSEHLTFELGQPHSKGDEDTFIDLLHFVDHWHWMVRRNLNASKIRNSRS